MSRRVRLVLFAVVAPVFAALFVLAARGLPDFGSEFHPYGDRAVAMATQRATANVVSSVNFDQRAVDTLGEEFIPPSSGHCLRWWWRYRCSLRPSWPPRGGCCPAW